MSTQKASFTKARDALVKAIADYQTATRDMNVALLRCAKHTGSIYDSLQTMVNASATIASRRH